MVFTWLTTLGLASITVHATRDPSVSNRLVMPIFFPINPLMALSCVRSDLDLHVHAAGEFQLHQGIDRLGGRAVDVHHAFVTAQLELLARLLVDVRRAEHRENALV